MFLLSLVLIAAKCNVNNNQMYKLMLDGQVLIAAKCNVNIDYINGLGRAEMF